MKQRLTNELAIFALAVQFLTRVPIPVGDAYSEQRLAQAPRYYPLVGLCVGAVCAGAFELAMLVFPQLVTVLLTVAIGLMLTGAFHEDGLADTFDSFGAIDKDKALSVMRDSRIGTYGAAALGTALALKVATLHELAPETVAAALIAAHGLSRLSAVLVIASSTYVRDQGAGKPTAAGIDRHSLGIAITTGVIVLLTLVQVIGPGATIGLLLFIIGGHFGMRALFERRLGGYTGDTLGAVQQVSELSVYLAVLAWQ
ncbi:MAG: adenosylcobinamide-GDP ribazoletransferase [Pseudomonadota bacterium]